MRGVVMDIKGRYAVLLNKSGEFVRVRNKNYTIGQTVTVTNNTSRICAVAASMLVVCGGIGSYFAPTGYVSVDINPSLLLTVNIYNKVIDVKPLNDDAVILLEKTDVKGMDVKNGVDALIETSKQVGYINDNNKDVIVEVVSDIRNIEIEERTDAEIVVEKAEKDDLTTAKKMGVSIAKAKAIEEYTEKNGGSVNDNAQRFADKSAKEIRKVLENTSEATPTPEAKEEIKSIYVAKVPSNKNKEPVKTRIEVNKNDEVTAEKQEIPSNIKTGDKIFKAPVTFFDDKEIEKKKREEEKRKEEFEKEEQRREPLKDKDENQYGKSEIKIDSDIENPKENNSENKIEFEPQKPFFEHQTDKENHADDNNKAEGNDRIEPPPINDNASDKKEAPSHENEPQQKVESDRDSYHDNDMHSDNENYSPDRENNSPDKGESNSLDKNNRNDNAFDGEKGNNGHFDGGKGDFNRGNDRNSNPNGGNDGNGGNHFSDKGNNPDNSPHGDNNSGRGDFGGHGGEDFGGRAGEK